MCLTIAADIGKVKYLLNHSGDAAVHQAGAQCPAKTGCYYGGKLHDRPVTITLEPVDLDSFTLRNRGLHWVQDYPYFR